MGCSMMDAERDYPTEFSEINKSTFESKDKAYLTSLIDNLKRRFPQLHLVTLLDYLQPQNAADAGPASIMELASAFKIEGAKLWNEFQSHHSCASMLDPPTLQNAVVEMWHSSNHTSMSIAYSLISKLLARIIVLPGSSAEAERIFFHDEKD